MKNTCFFCLLVMVTFAASQNPPLFDDYFTGQALRIDFCQTGDAKEELITVEQLSRELVWPGSRQQLIDPFGYGRYALKIYDVATNALIYSTGFDCMYGEYRTTTPAIEGIRRTFKRSARFPFPRRPIHFVLEKRDKNNLPAPFFILKIDPADYHISTESDHLGEIYNAQISGDMASKVDILFISEGYTAAEKSKFVGDVDRMRDFLFSVEPYKTLHDRINIRGLFIASSESGMDEPREHSWKNTALDASFNAFDLDRYMLIEEGHQLRRLASQAPYDALIVLVNAARYGGGGIYNDYAVTTVDHRLSPRVFVHEFGHSFAGLADEYYASDVAYNDFYPKGVEPMEPNITALIDPEHIKWQTLISPGISLPTEYGKAEMERLHAARRENTQAMDKAVQEAQKKGRPENEIEKMKKPFEGTAKKLDAQIEAHRKNYEHLADKVGAFEGAGYSSKGLYRPMMDCLMISNNRDRFCRVCEAAIAQMIEYYAR